MIRAEGRRRLRIVLAATGVVVLGAAGWGVTRSPLVDVDRIDVKGSSRSGPGAVVSASGLGEGRPMVSVDEGAAARAVERLPWVAQARVRRDWPGTVRIVVTERVPVAAVDLGARGWALVDESAQVLELVAARPDSLVAVLDLPGELVAGGRLPAPGADLLAVAQAVPDELRPRLVGLTAAGPGGAGIEVVLEGGTRLRIGRPDRLNEKFRSVLTVLRRVNTTGMDLLDVRVPDSPVLTRSGEAG